LHLLPPKLENAMCAQTSNKSFCFLIEDYKPNETWKILQTNLVTWKKNRYCEMKCHSRAGKAKKRKKNRVCLLYWSAPPEEKILHSLVQLVEFFLNLVHFTLWVETSNFILVLEREDRNFIGFQGRGRTALAFPCWKNRVVQFSCV
jgi:hypothetical protein